MIFISPGILLRTFAGTIGLASLEILIFWNGSSFLVQLSFLVRQIVVIVILIPESPFSGAASSQFPLTWNLG